MYHDTISYTCIVGIILMYYDHDDAYFHDITPVLQSYLLSWRLDPNQPPLYSLTRWQHEGIINDGWLFINHYEPPLDNHHQSSPTIPP